MHENDSLFCEMSADTSVTRDRLLALSYLSAWSKVAASFIDDTYNHE